MEIYMVRNRETLQPLLFELSADGEYLAGYEGMTDGVWTTTIPSDAYNMVTPDNGVELGFWLNPVRMRDVNVEDWEIVTLVI